MFETSAGSESLNEESIHERGVLEMNEGVVDFRGVVSSSVVAPEGISDQSLGFIQKAHSLLALASSSEGVDSFEYAFQAGLRCAGAVIADAEARKVLHSGRKAKKTKRQGSAWAQLRRVAPEFAEWADALEAYSPLRNDVRLGLTVLLPQSKIAELIDLSSRFLHAVEDQLGVLPAAA